MKKHVITITGSIVLNVEAETQEEAVEKIKKYLGSDYGKTIHSTYPPEEYRKLNENVGSKKLIALTELSDWKIKEENDLKCACCHHVLNRKGYYRKHDPADCESCLACIVQRA